ncbi:hypothetical protein PIB30_032588 [Stylosanthes scabra]|uniref:Uncharacterized protein n=1 Tax=Stylosanthes scabra TaxID=79078 RepID=A0ABU6SC24_9FABA|nr:hypothetical protein [Stylosanthes scabra]
MRKIVNDRGRLIGPRGYTNDGHPLLVLDRSGLATITDQEWTRTHVRGINKILSANPNTFAKGLARNGPNREIAKLPLVSEYIREWHNISAILLFSYSIKRERVEQELVEELVPTNFSAAHANFRSR